MMNAITCCMECKPPKRHPGCHGSCEQYIAERDRWMEIKADLREKEKWPEKDYRVKTFIKQRRKRGKK